MIVVTCTQIGEATPYPGTTALLPVLGTALVIGAGCATPDLGVGHFLSKPAMRSIGRLSYSWYLWHWPVLLLAPALFGGDLGLAGRLAMVVVSFGLAILTLHLIENPVAVRARAETLGAAQSRGGWRTDGCGRLCRCLVLLMVRPVPVGEGTAEAPVAPVRACWRPRRRLPHRRCRCATRCWRRSRSLPNQRPVPTNLTPALGAIAKPDVFVNGCVLSWRDVEQPDCVSGDAGAPTTVALVGDSHAAMWQPALEPIARDRHWRLETMSKVLCPLMDLPINSPYLGRKFTECEQWRGDVLARLEKERPQLIVLDMSRRYGADFGFTSYDQAWLDEPDATGAAAARNGRKRFGAQPGAGSALDGADVCVGAYGRRGRVLALEDGWAERSPASRRRPRRRRRGGGRGLRCNESDRRARAYLGDPGAGETITSTSRRPWTAKKNDVVRLGTIVATAVELLEAVSVMIAAVMPSVSAAMREQLGLAAFAGDRPRTPWPFTLPARAPGGGCRGGRRSSAVAKEKEAELLARFSHAEGSKHREGGERGSQRRWQSWKRERQSGGGSRGGGVGRGKGGVGSVEAGQSAPGDRGSGGAARAEGGHSIRRLCEGVELRVGLVLSAERVKKKDRLLDLRVDVGDAAPRRIIAGIAKSYAPEQIVGKRVVVLCNLAPREVVKGLLSEGMLLGGGRRRRAQGGDPRRRAAGRCSGVQ